MQKLNSCAFERVRQQKWGRKVLEFSTVQNLDDDGAILATKAVGGSGSTGKVRNPNYKGAKKGHRAWGTVRKLPSGKYQASYIGKDLVRHKADSTFDNKINAEGWLANEKAYADRCRMTGEVWKSPSQRAEESRATVLLLRDYGKQWIAERKLKESTRNLYTGLWTNHIEPKLGKVALAELSAQAVRSWYADFDAQQETKRKHAYALLHAIVKTALKDELIERNPCQINGAMTTRRKREPEILTLAALNTVVDAMPERLKVVVLLAVYCGLRWGEVSELRSTDFNADLSVLTVSRGVTHKPICRVTSTKSDKTRKLNVPKLIRPAIREHLNLWASDDPERKGQLFVPVQGGCHLNDQVFAETWYKPALSKANRPGVHFHDLRHTGATWLSQVGATTAEVQAFLGHATPHMALHYTAATDERRELLVSCAVN
jgi:integrase